MARITHDMDNPAKAMATGHTNACSVVKSVCLILAVALARSDCKSIEITDKNVNSGLDSFADQSTHTQHQKTDGAQ